MDLSPRLPADEDEQNRYNEFTFRSLLEHSGDGVVILSSEGKPLYISPSVKNILGYTESEVMEMDLASLTHIDDLLPLSLVWERVLANPGVTLEGHTGRMLHKNGSWRWIEATVTNLLHDPFVRGIVDNFRDITEKKLADEKLIHANQLYSFISQVNQTIVHSKSETELFKTVCDIAIKFGHFKVAWIGVFDQPNRLINLVVQSGMCPEDLLYFINAPYTVNGPQDQVLIEDSHFICNNIQNDPSLVYLRAFAEKRGYRSAMILPIKKAGQTIGTFNVYASETDFFKEQEAALLVEATGDVSFALDIFEKEKLRVEAVRDLQKSESNLSAVIENTDASIYSLDRDLCYITFNKSLRDNISNLYGLKIQPGDNVYIFLGKIDPQESKSWQDIYVRALSGETVKFEKEFIVEDSFSCISFSIYPIVNGGNIIGLSCFAIDITKQKVDLIQKEKMLSDILKRNKDLEQFSYIVSHNLRSPLATIIGLSDLLMAYELDEEKLTLVEGITTSVKKLDEVIHDLNHVLQVNNSVNENKTVVQFSRILSDIELSINNLLQSEEVQIIPDFSVVDEMLTLKSYLYSIFLNLISNSIKYRQPQIRPVIMITSVFKGKTIELIFSDNGLGIDLGRNAESVFGLYKRFHAHTEGKGVGLYMVKMQVEALGGTISIESQINTGTTFTIRLQA